METKVSSEIRAIPLPDCAKNPEDKEISDGEDDDRNHKHRRQSMEGDRQEPYFSAPYRKRSKPNDKAQSNFHSQYNADGELSSRFQKPRHYMTNFPGDLVANRGRSRDFGSWSQHDYRFDIAHQMVPSGPIPPPFFAGRGMHSGLNKKNGPWAGGSGLILGMPNGAVDQIHSSLNVGAPRQRCRDFEERGFCLRGDMCPMEHGINRIVIEDLQSLSQFNLPVSLPTAQLPGNSAGSTIGSQVHSSPTVLINNNGSEIDADGSGADVYDPDQPLWNNNPSSQLARTSFCIESTTSSSVWGRKNASENKLVSEFGSATNNQTSDHHAKKSNTRESQKRTGQSVKNPAQKAVRSLYVNQIPLKDNKKEALLSHFKKFGEVVDVYVPPKTEHAFVQFSKREEAERALQSPDAVMGNRFIKLLWAHRDSFFHTTAKTSNKNIPSVESSKTLSSEAKHLTTPPVQKKLENLEIMKEEVRKKQELLEQRRKEFRQQLDKLQKNATGTKVEVQKLKVGGPNDTPKSETPKHSKLQPAASLDKPQPVESATLHNLKTKLSVASQEVSNLKLAASPRNVNRSPYHANRYKLDNRPTSFLVAAPLPAEFANVNALRDHFTVFGDLSNVDLENPDVHGDEDKCCKNPTNMSARVHFKTRQAAERAFVNGKSLNGHNLQLTWLIPTKSPKSSNTNPLDSSGPEIQSMEKSDSDVVEKEEHIAEIGEVG